MIRSRARAGNADARQIDSCQQTHQKIGSEPPIGTAQLVVGLIEKEMSSAAAAPAPSPKRDRAGETQHVHRRVAFISHSSEDKEFARRLVQDLKKDDAPMELWIDEAAIDPGQSLTSSISEGISKADYLLLIHSRNTAESAWVKREVEIAASMQINGEGIVVIAAVLDDAPLPIILRDRLWIDFRTSYADGYSKILSFFRREETRVLPPTPIEQKTLGGDDCPMRLSRLTLGQLRRQMQKGLSRLEVRTAWFDVFEENMDDFVPGGAIDICLVELLERCKKRQKMAELLRTICDNWPHVSAT